MPLTSIGNRKTKLRIKRERQTFPPCPTHRQAERNRDLLLQSTGLQSWATSDEWIDLNLGHQLVFHVTGAGPLPESSNPVDADNVPIPHFGVVLTPDQHQELCKRIIGKVEMIIEPSVRFEGTPGEQRTVFFRDPNGYALEFKSFANDDDLFAPF